jgi:hypothetical protein
VVTSRSTPAAVPGGADAAFPSVATVSRLSRLAFSPNILCRWPARIRCENYGKIVLERGIHRFNDEIFQTLTDIGRSHGSNIILVICNDGLNCGSFLLGSHAGTFNFPFSVGNQKRNDIPRLDWTRASAILAHSSARNRACSAMSSENSPR